MKKTLKVLLFLVIIGTVSFLMPEIIDSPEYSIEAGEADLSEEEIPVSPNAYTVVEIVPYVGMTELSYLVGGQEPIDGSRMDYYNAPGELSFLAGAISVYKSYTEEPLPAFGNPDSGWSLGYTIVTQNGYFENVGNQNGGRYTRGSWQTSYIRVADGTGTHRAVLDAQVPDNIYSGGEVTNRKNVKAYFVNGNTGGEALYNNWATFAPEIVRKSEDNTGDYDYDYEKGIFYLNKGHGEYDVIFVQKGSSNPYYMLNDYEIVDDNSGDYSFPIRYEAMPGNTGGNYIKDNGDGGNIFFYDRWSGSYRWVQDDRALTKANYSTEGGKIWVQNQKVMVAYQYKLGVTLFNNEYFKLHTLGVPANQVKDYPVEVITITPEDLSKPENHHYIDEADLFYINANWRHNTNGYFNLFEKYSPEADTLPVKYLNASDTIKRDNLNFAVHDLDWPTTVKLFKKIAGIGCYKTPVIIDNTYAQEALSGATSNNPYHSLTKTITLNSASGAKPGTICNLAKLYIMLYQRNTVDFYNAFMNPDIPGAQLITQVLTTVNKSGSTGSFVSPSVSPYPSFSATDDRALYWNADTFKNYSLNAEGRMTYISNESDLQAAGIKHGNLFATTTDIMDNVLVTNGQDLFTDKLFQPIPLPDDAAEKAAIDASVIHGEVINKGSLKLSDITNVISNNGNNYPNTGGVAYPDGGYVEGPPGTTPPTDDTDGLEEGIRSFKRVLNIQPTADFTSSETNIRKMLGNNIQIVNMTMTQFNSSIEDINTRYDLIYLGSSYGRFNINASNGKIVFDKVGDYYYFPVGDRKKLPGNIFVNYQGNDLGAKRRADLEEFLKAGYPIVADDNIYNLKQISSDAIIYSFITYAKSRYSDCFLNYKDFTSSNTTAKTRFLINVMAGLNITRPQINLVEPVLPDDSEVNYIYVPSTNILTIKFSLLPKGILPSSYTYDAHLFVDENRDGIFDEEEELEAIPRGATSANGLRESHTKYYIYQYDMSALNGVYQWKLTLEREDDDDSTEEERKMEAIRTSVTGYAAVSNKQTLSILHIRDNDGFNLESMVNDTASLFKPLTSGLKDYELLFDTMTVEEFRSLYLDPNPAYNDISSSKLAGYHLLILDNKNEPLVPTDSSVAPEVADRLRGIESNIRDEIAFGLNIIFTKGALDYSKQSNYYSESGYSFIDARTYNYINRYTEDTNKPYIYSKLDTNGPLNADSTYNTAYITKSNEGSITRYPYQINTFIPTATTSYSRDVTIDFNPEAGLRLIGWFSLSDNRSPVVNSSVSAANRYAGMYSTSPNDVKNNYYLFSNNGCYYSGINLAGANAANAEDEIKLFVNTIIAAYQASGRQVSAPPVIAYVHPDITLGADSIEQLLVTESDIVGTEMILKFRISGSSSKMSLAITLDAANPTDNWNETIYSVSGPDLGEAIDISGTDKLVENKIYALKIPVNEIRGSHLLNIKAINGEGKEGEATLRLIYQQNPVVTIEKPVPIANSKTSYLYVDIDFNALDAGESYLDSASDFRVEFEIKDALTNVKLQVESEGEILTDGTGTEVRVYPASDDLGTPVELTSLPVGRYVMYIPVTLMKNHSSRELVITATDLYVNRGEAKVVLVRRSLFPLD